MKTFEERYTAWLDGRLTERERAEFEAALPDPAGARREAEQWERMRGDLRAALTPAPMPHGEFVNHQVLSAITPPRPPQERAGAAGWTVARLAWSGVFLLAVTGLVTAVVLPRDGGRPDQAAFVSQVIDARTKDPALGAYAFSAPGGAAVLWINDAGYIPAEENIR